MSETMQDSSCAARSHDSAPQQQLIDSMLMDRSAAHPAAETTVDAQSTQPAWQYERKSMQEIRQDALMAQRVETGLIFMEMLGLDDALAYWRASEVPESIIDRLVNGNPAGKAPASQACAPASRDLPTDARISLFYSNTGRRRDVVGAAVVQAALAIFQELGRDRAVQMLRREGLSEAVIDRVFAPHGEGRRSA